MAEQQTEVRTYEVNYICDKCGKGKMFHDVIGEPLFEAFDHICPECGYCEILDKIYPHYEHKEI